VVEDYSSHRLGGNVRELPLARNKTHVQLRSRLLPRWNAPNLG
jgi:hypothetical protein